KARAFPEKALALPSPPAEVGMKVECLSDREDPEAPDAPAARSSPPTANSPTRVTQGRDQPISARGFTDRTTPSRVPCVFGTAPTSRETRRLDEARNRTIAFANSSGTPSAHPEVRVRTMEARARGLMRSLAKGRAARV